jgi:hypothetical protein
MFERWGQEDKEERGVSECSAVVGTACELDSLKEAC